MRGDDNTTPKVIREECRRRFWHHLEDLSDIAADPDARDGDRVKAIEALGKFGLGAADQAAVHIHAEGAALLGVVALPALGEGSGNGGQGALPSAEHDMCAVELPDGSEGPAAAADRRVIRGIEQRDVGHAGQPVEDVEGEGPLQ